MKILPAWDGLAAPGDADCVFTRFKGIIFTLKYSIPHIPHFYLLFCSSWGWKIKSIQILMKLDTFCAFLCLFGCNQHTVVQNNGNHFQNIKEKVRHYAEKRELSDSLGPLTETFSSPLPAPLVKTLKSATSFTLTPLGWSPLPVALQAFGFIAEKNNNKCKREHHFTEHKAESSQQLTAMLITNSNSHWIP